MNNYVPPQMGHNGGPQTAADTAVAYMGQEYLPLFDRYRNKALFGGRGSGKSHAIATALVMIAAKNSVLIVCARQFQNSIRDSVKELLEQKISSLGLTDQFRILEREIIHKTTGARFIFIGLDRNPESAKSLEGADICWVEEARMINARSMEILIPTVRKPGSEMWWSWNPEFSTDPVDLYFRGSAPPPNSFIKQIYIEDNPWFYQSEMPQEMWHMQQGNAARYKHVWLGDYDDDYSSKIFSDIIIGRIDIPKSISPLYGMDFGFGTDPSVIIKAYIINFTKQIYIAREGYGRVPLRQLPAIIRDVVDTDADEIVCDSSQPGTIDHLNSEGFNCIAAKKGPGSVKAGINWLQGYQIIIDPDCENTREEARLYSWQVDRITKKRLNVPVDAHNHCWDALRYGTESAQTNPAPPEDGGVIRFNFGKRR